MWSRQKISVKNVIIKQVSYESLSNISVVNIELILERYCGDNLKYGLLSKHLFQRNQQYGL